MAQMLVRIARNKVMRNGKRTHQLPDSITILNLIAGLPVAVLEQALDAGVTASPSAGVHDEEVGGARGRQGAHCVEERHRSRGSIVASCQCGRKF